MEQINFQADKKQVKQAVKKAEKEIGIIGISALLRYLIKQFLNK
jgi:hypothetical protein